MTDNTGANANANTSGSTDPVTQPYPDNTTGESAADSHPTAATTPIPPQDPTPPTQTPPAPAAAVPAPLPKRRPLFATILWGALMLALAAFVAARELVPGGFDLVTWLLTAVVGIGLLLVVAGIAAASRRAG
ncbi:hypothetical protein [Cryobacterium arcticum]|uniref:Uncharacterized protein n=1 Tax=Cryobacterium arcticum TaxID=670052 RepID=A0A317ZQ92_9MICO|nr:hypothetical protein [Cryobacterium arcticum]PXA67299.1 hypothetical protein CTB96_11150 [Cryobacterium arcticum]